MTELRQKFEAVFDIGADIPEDNHFWLKWFSGCVFLSVETCLITMLYYRIIRTCINGVESISLPWVWLISFSLAVALDLSILKIYSVIKKYRNLC